MKASPINIGKHSEFECKCCLRVLPLSSFPVRNDRSGLLRPYCKQCARDGNKARYISHKRNMPFKLKATRAKSRSQSLSVPFGLTPEYLEGIWTGKCPVLGVEIYLVEKDRSDEFAAELDRFIPALGYVEGNVTFLSRRANRLKNNVTSVELKQLINWMEKYENN